MTRSILIEGGRVFSAHSDFTSDILVADGKIAAIGTNLSGKYGADEVIDANGLYVIPGGIDVHTHMELPFMGTFSADDFETGTLAGLYGGTTAIIDFAMQTKGHTLAECVGAWREKAAKSVSDYGFHVGVTDFNDKVAKEIPGIIADGIPTFKCFMAYKGALMIDDKQIMGLMGVLKQHGGMLSVHAENGDMLDFLSQKYHAEGKLTPRYHALTHTPEAEDEAAGRAMILAELMGVPLYVVHTSYRKVLDQARKNMLKGQRIYLETCPQYLLLDDSCYDEPNFGGAKYVMSPPIRKKEDQAALWKGLRDGLVQVVGTDHCPFNLKGQKEMGRDDFAKIPNGAAGIEHRIELLFSEGVLKGRIDMNRLVEVTSANPAKIFGVANKGSIDVGKDADITLLDPNEEHMLGAKTHHHNVDSSIFEGLEVRGKIKTVIADGRIAIRNGKAEDVKKGAGKFIQRRLA
jgi:dihydropyrimidinase